MNVEINFLEKQENKKIAPFLITIFAILLIVSAVTVILYQNYLLTSEIQGKRDYAEMLEIHVSEIQADYEEQKQLTQLKHNLENLKQEALPTVDMYRDIVGLLAQSNQLIYYENSQSNQFIVDTQFPNFNSLSSYVSNLLAISYIRDVQLTSVSRLENGYLATLTVQYDEETVKKELKPYD